MPSPRKRIGLGIVALAVASSGISTLVAAPASANPLGTGLVINEVYGAGGNGGALYNADYVELFNPTSGAVSLSGLNLQYRASNNNVGGTVALAGSVGAGKTFLVQMGTAGSTGAALPTPDQVSGTNVQMAAAGGQVVLGTGTTFGTGNLAGATGVVDMVGTSGASSYEGTASTVVGQRDAVAQPRGQRRRHRRQLGRHQRRRSLPDARRWRRHDPAPVGRHPHHRPDPGHRRRDQPAGRPERDHAGRGDRGVPDGRPQRLLPPDRRHRWRERRDAGCLRRRLRLRALAECGELPGARCLGGGHRPGQRVQRLDRRSPRTPSPR